MKILSFIVLFCAGILSAQTNFNLELISNTEIGEGVNDIWGYVSADGVEYAIIGSRTKTTIFNIADPVNPVEVASISGSTSTWRDIKSWKDHIYVVADAGNDGLLIIDMSEAPDTITHTFWQPILTVDQDTNQLTRAHNIYIDENGYAYLAGCRVMDDRDRRGAIILDLNEDPKNPMHVGSQTRAYSHDLFVRDNIMYASEIYNGEIALYDVTDKANPLFLGSAPTSTDFTHNAWIDDEAKYVFTTDERADAYIDAFDITDPTDIKFLDKFRPLETENNGVIPHNTHYHNGFLVTSWYTDGVVITDAHRPENMVKVGAYDTFLGGHGGFSGCWGAYPFLPSGLVLASDRQTGLYIFNPNYVRACYLEGTVTNAENGEVINGANILINSEQLAKGSTDATGSYKTGLAEAGTYTVRFSHPEYMPLELEAELINGEITILDARLTPIEELVFVVNVLENPSQDPIENAQIEISNIDRFNAGSTDSTGTAVFSLTNENYTISVGAWGYNQALQLPLNPEEYAGDKLTFIISQSYEDDFMLDLGWTVTGDASTGMWTRDIPNPTTDPDDASVFANVNADVSNADSDDVGDYCYMTGNGGGTAGDDDVDNGTTTLTSPRIFFDTLDQVPVIEYRAWFYTGGGNGDPFNDTLKVFVTNGTERVLVDSYSESTNGWTDVVTINLANAGIDFSNGYQVQFEVSDDPDFGHFVEAGVDVFRAYTEFILDIDEIASNEIIVTPNPFNKTIQISLGDYEFYEVTVFDISGNKIISRQITDDQISLNLNVPPGVYSLLFTNKNGKSASKLIVKQ